MKENISSLRLDWLSLYIWSLKHWDNCENFQNHCRCFILFRIYSATLSPQFLLSQHFWVSELRLLFLLRVLEGNQIKWHSRSFWSEHDQSFSSSFVDCKNFFKISSVFLWSFRAQMYFQFFKCWNFFWAILITSDFWIIGEDSL